MVRPPRCDCDSGSVSPSDLCAINLFVSRLAPRPRVSVLLLGLRISCVLDVCGAFGGRVLGEDFTASGGDRLVALRLRLSQQSFELGEDLLDGVEVGEYSGRKMRRAPTSRIAFRTAFPLWEPRLSRITTSPGFSVGTRTCST
jgi:hypothetical protein